MDWKTKYLKYKVKYNKLLKEQHGGSKLKAQEIADAVTKKGSTENLFDEVLQYPLDSDPILNMVINGNSNKEKIIEKLFRKISSEMFKYKYAHNIIRKHYYLLRDFETKNYSPDPSKPSSKICYNQSGTEVKLHYNNLPQSGLDAIRDKLFINTLPEFSTLKEESTYNYVLIFVTDLSNNQTYYYFVFAEYTAFIEYAIKHSNLRVFFPDEWSYHDNIDHGFIASGEFKISKSKQKITYDFNSSSNIIGMLDPMGSIYKNFTDTFITPDIKSPLIPNEQLFSLTYLYIINDLVKRTIRSIIFKEAEYITFRVQIHSDYTNRPKLISVGKSDEKNIYSYGLLFDPYPANLGGLHDYTNYRCYTDAEIENFNTNTIVKYNDLNDTNINLDKLNCIKKKDQPVLVNSTNPENIEIFKNSPNCN